MVHEEHIVKVFKTTVFKNLKVFFVFEELSDFFILLFQFPVFFFDDAVPNVVEDSEKGVNVFIEGVLLEFLLQKLKKLRQ